LLDLGSSEFQGDEAKVVWRAAALLQGLPDALHAHYRPPGEILLTASLSGALNALTELHSRLPFALAGVIAVSALFQLVRVMFGTPAALAAGLLIAINGYFVAFGRTLQYPSVTLLIDVLALLCLVRFAQEPASRVGYAMVGGLLLAGSALTALSAVLLLPVAVVVLWPSVFGKCRAGLTALTAWLWPLLVLVPALAAAYVIRPQVGAESSELPSAAPYLGQRLGERLFYFNVADFLDSANHYNSGLYVLVLLGALLLLLVRLGLRQWDRLIGPAEATHFRSRIMVILVWVAGPLTAHLLLVRAPQTHWREVFPGLIVVGAVILAGIYAKLGSQVGRLTALLAGGLFLASVVHFVYVSWLQRWPEYQLAYPDYRHPLDWNPNVKPSGGVQTVVPRYGGGVYGAAHHHGWKTVAAMVARGVLPADYDTNEREAVSAWYLKQPRSCPKEARLYVHAPNTPQARSAIERGRAPPGFSPAYQVQVEGRTMLGLSVRERSGLRRQPLAEEEAGWFDRERTSPWQPVGELHRSESPRRC
jgi:hypothetical protein